MSMDQELLFRVVDTETGKDVTALDAVEDIVLEAKGQEFAAHLVWCDMDGWYVSADGGLALLDECGNYEPAPDRYQVVWGDGARAGE